MPVHPIAQLQSLSEVERTRLVSIFKKLTFRKSAFFAIPVLISIVALIYFNSSDVGLFSKEYLEITNVTFVVITVLCLRLIVSEFIDYGKEIKSPNKKIIKTHITDMKNGEIVLGNKSFSREEVLLDAPDFLTLKKGDAVTLELSVRSNTIFSILVGSH